ncbi:hypothetical protein HDU91_007404 [Kappamyces sp. JEL0680]|nr:hypothetical protein HDU91_007404 [Kappamyces sp. JEL0680]
MDGFLYRGDEAPAKVLQRIKRTENTVPILDRGSRKALETVYLQQVDQHHYLSSTFCTDFLDSVMEHPSTIPAPPESGVPLTHLSELGIEMAARYASRVMPETENIQEKLQTLYRQAASYHHSDSADGFDWFAATVFIMYCGNVDRSLRFLHWLSLQPIGPLLWPKISSDTQTQSLYHDIEARVERDIPTVASAFTLDGCTVSQVCRPK